jgi:hypothetical protein
MSGAGAVRVRRVVVAVGVVVVVVVILLFCCLLFSVCPNAGGGSVADWRGGVHKKNDSFLIVLGAVKRRKGRLSLRVRPGMGSGLAWAPAWHGLRPGMGSVMLVFASQKWTQGGIVHVIDKGYGSSVIVNGGGGACGRARGRGDPHGGNRASRAIYIAA